MIFERYLRHRAIKKFIKRVGPRLKFLHGKRKYYTERQISSALDEFNLNSKYSIYAYGLYLPPKKLEGVLQTLNTSESSKSIRKFLAVAYLGGYMDYSFADIATTNSFCVGDYAAGTSDSGGGYSGDGGGDGGGGDGGG